MAATTISRKLKVAGPEISKLTSTTLSKNATSFIWLMSYSCPHCKDAIPIWNTLYQTNHLKYPNLYLARLPVDVIDDTPEVDVGDFEGVPKFRLYTDNGQNFVDFSGNRSVTNIQKWLDAQLQSSTEEQPIKSHYRQYRQPHYQQYYRHRLPILRADPIQDDFFNYPIEIYDPPSSQTVPRSFIFSLPPIFS
jgi:thiol-disulfide isomerase/thioredoxin